MGSLEGRVAIITGGGGNGIGASISRLFAKEGAKLVINDLGVNVDGSGGGEGPAKTIAEEIVANGGAAEHDSGDIADTATGERLVQKAVDAYGKLDIVVNVAGILRDRMIFNMTPEDWDAVIRVHLRGTFSTVRPASAYWREQRDENANNRIINFTSVSGLHGGAGQPNYSAAKLGIVGLTFSLARALERYGVTANAISPGAATRMTATVPARGEAPAEPKEEDPAELARRSPDNVALPVGYIASERSRWLTGRIVQASGYHVGLYNVPQEIKSLDSDSRWDLGALADAMESDFKPLANGLAPFGGMAGM